MDRFEKDTSASAAEGSVDQIFAELLDLFVTEIEANQGDNLRSIIQFGSTVHRPLKRDTDLDLMLVFKEVPAGRGPRLLITAKAEKAAEPFLARLLEKGFHLDLSPIIKSVEEFGRFSLLYLDMVEHSRIKVDKDGMAKSIFDKTAEWIKTSGARRVQKGLYWYWDLNPNCKPGDVFKIGF